MTVYKCFSHFYLCSRVSDHFVAIVHMVQCTTQHFQPRSFLSCGTHYCVCYPHLVNDIWHSSHQNSEGNSTCRHACQPQENVAQGKYFNHLFNWFNSHQITVALFSLGGSIFATMIVLVLLLLMRRNPWAWVALMDSFNLLQFVGLQGCYYLAYNRPEDKTPSSSSVMADSGLSSSQSNTELVQDIA